MSEYEMKRINGKRKAVHVLLMEKILGRELKENEVVHHINGDKHDNRPENLQVMDRGEHSALHGRGRRASPETLKKQSEASQGRASSNRKLTEVQVKEIARKLIEGVSLSVLQKEYGVSPSAIENIRNGRTYRDWLSEYPDEAFPLGKKKRKGVPAKRLFGIEEVTDIRIRLLVNESVASIAEKYGVTTSTILNIRDNVTYQDIPWPVELMRLHQTDDMTQLAMLMLSLPLDPDKEEYTALKEDYAILPDWRSVMMLRLIKRALAGDREIALVLLAMAGYGEGIDRIIAEESVVINTMNRVFFKKKQTDEK